MINFDYIELTGRTEKEILKQARTTQREMVKKFGKGSYSLQDAVYAAIDSWMEYNQG